MRAEVTMDGGPELRLEQMLRKLAQRSCVIMAGKASAGANGMAVVKDGRFEGSLVRADFERARQAGFIEPCARGGGWRLSAKGRDAVRRLTCGAGPRERIEPCDGRPGVNADESPLAWLRRRRSKEGAALISEAQFQAGERLRADFSFAQLGPRVTASWDAALGATGGVRRGVPGGSVDIADGVVAARERVNRALQAVGPELGGVLVDVCCFLKGLEDLERSIGWPQRSGKVVLQIALTSLARHYGIGDGHGAGCGRARHWGTSDYRPSIEGDGQPAAD